MDSWIDRRRPTSVVSPYTSDYSSTSNVRASAWAARCVANLKAHSPDASIASRNHETLAPHSASPLVSENFRTQENEAVRQPLKLPPVLAQFVVVTARLAWNQGGEKADQDHQSGSSAHRSP